jgi:hypothetical protein
VDLTSPPMKPKNTVWIPGGSFLMGSNDFYPEERPVRTVTVGAFWMRLSRRGRLRRVGGQGTADRGMAGVRRTRWPGGRHLRLGRRFAPRGRMMANTWQGDFPVHNNLFAGYELTSPIGKFPPNGYGLVDIVGNVWEWTRARTTRAVTQALPTPPMLSKRHPGWTCAAGRNASRRPRCLHSHRPLPRIRVGRPAISGSPRSAVRSSIGSIPGRGPTDR